jgi:ADP-ribose pyrophosphatase YjhB (NUDIX family)
MQLAPTNDANPLRLGMLRRLSRFELRKAESDERRIFCHPGGGPKDEGRYYLAHQLTYRPSAYAIIFDETGRVLLVRSEVLEVRWNLPGGGIDRGETLVEGLRREVREETGLEIEVGPLVAVFDEFEILVTGKPIHAQRHFYLAYPNGGQLRPGGNGFDSDTVRYLERATIPNETIHDAVELDGILEKVLLAYK